MKTDQSVTYDHFSNVSHTQMDPDQYREWTMHVTSGRWMAFHKQRPTTYKTCKTIKPAMNNFIG